MAAGPMPDERVWRVRVKVQHPVGPGPRLEFGSDPGHPGRQGSDWSHKRASEHIAERLATLAFSSLPASNSNPSLQPANPRLDLLPASTQPVKVQRLWGSRQRRQHATIQQPWRRQSWWWRPFLRRPSAITSNL
jgi:hypothetical protein